MDFRLASKIFWVIALINAALGSLGRAVSRLLDGQWVFGIGFAGLAILLAYCAYKTATSKTPPPAPWTPSSAARPPGLRGSDYFKKCPACGKFTRDAKVCRICGHDLTYSVSDAPQIKTRYKPSTTPGTSEL
jgi:hypothetical protein